jgi:SOS-response transcriptional repressor LexA
MEKSIPGEVRETRATGFASPAQGYEAKSFDFNEILAGNAAATFVMRASGDRFRDKGILPGSLLVVDRSVEPSHESFAVVAHDGEFLCSQMIVKPYTKEIVFTDGRRELPRRDVELFGTVKAVVTLL